MDNHTFISFMKKGLSTLYSSDKEISKNVFDFFKNIQKEIKNFIFIPIINNNFLCEFKKHLYLGVLANHFKENDLNDLKKYAFLY